MDIGQAIPSVIDSTNAEAMQFYGLLGDYIGGFWGTIVGVLTLLVVLFTWRQTRNTEYRSKTYQIFSEMLRTHEEIVSSMQVNSFKGRDSFVVFLSEFYAIYKVVQGINTKGDWELNDRINIAYSYTFFGPHIVAAHALKDYSQEKIKDLHDAIQAMRRVRRDPKKVYSGHQNRLSHYFRNLYSAYAFIDSSRLKAGEKRSLAKVLRSKLSNYEQALLALNVICHLGGEWERTGIFAKYKPVKNIPERFFTFDDEFALDSRFPYIDFEWEASPKRKTKAWSVSALGYRLSLVRHARK